MYVIIFAVVRLCLGVCWSNSLFDGFLLNWHRKTTECRWSWVGENGRSKFSCTFPCILENLNDDTARHMALYNTTCNPGEKENLFSKLKKVSAIYSQFQTYQFHQAFSIIKLNQFISSSSFIHCMYSRQIAKECARFTSLFSHRKKTKNEVKLN